MIRSRSTLPALSFGYLLQAKLFELFSGDDLLSLDRASLKDFLGPIEGTLLFNKLKRAQSRTQHARLAPAPVPPLRSQLTTHRRCNRHTLK